MPAILGAGRPLSVPNARIWKRDSGYSYQGSFETFVAVAIAVIAALLLLVTLRGIFLRRLRAAQNESSSASLGMVAAPDIPPPPIYACKIVPCSTPIDEASGTVSWDQYQPFALVLDENTSSYLQRNKKEGAGSSWRRHTASAPAKVTVQATFFVSLPSQDSEFPEHLRRRDTEPPVVIPVHHNSDSADASASIKKPLPGHLAALRSSRPSSIRTTRSARELGEERRETMLRELEQEETGETERPPVQRSGSAASQLASSGTALMERYAALAAESGASTEGMGTLMMGSTELAVTSSSSESPPKLFTLHDWMHLAEEACEVRDASIATV